MKMTYSNLLKDIRDLPKFEVYRNSNAIVNLEVALTVDDVIKAGLISRLNILLLSERGEGKTQLMEDVKNSLFDGRGVYIRARPDMKAKELYEIFDIQKLQKILSEKVKAPITEIDEINRAPAIVQNEFFHMCDGYIEYDNRRIPLGLNNYHIVMASANIGGDTYAGTFEMDNAILDRFHLILNLDHYPIQVKDDLEIVSSSVDPRVVESSQKDKIEVLSNIAEAIEKIDIDMDSYVALLYLRKGLDYCLPERSNGRQSKRTIMSSIPRVCEGCKRFELNCGYMRPISVRTGKVVLALARALRVIMDSKNDGEVKRFDGGVTYHEVLEAFRLTAPYSGILDSNWIQKEYYNNPNIALDDLVARLKKEFDEKKDEMKILLRKALEGDLPINIETEFNEEWSFYIDMLQDINTVAKQDNLIESLKDGRIDKLSARFPFLRILTGANRIK